MQSLKKSETKADGAEEDAESKAKSELEVAEIRMEIEQKQGKVKRRRPRRRPRKKQKVLWVESFSAALPPSRARWKKPDQQSFRWIEADPPVVQSG